MNVALDPVRLRRELARRGMNARDLSREARVSGATVSTALAGRGISATSARLIAETLARVPVVAAIDSLLPSHPGVHVIDWGRSL